MRHRKLFIATAIFFLLISTSYYWESELGILAMPAFLLLIICFLILTGILIGQTYYSIREKGANKDRLYLVGFMALILAVSFLFPNGLINFESLERGTVLIAQREGAANCRTVLRLKSNKKFMERNVCLGVTETTGTYRLEGDTVYFENSSSGRFEDDHYQFAVIRKTKGKNGIDVNDLVRFRNHSDTIGVALWIVQNDLAE